MGLNIFAEWVVAENPKLAYEDICEIPASILDELYPETEPRGKAWDIIEKIMVAIRSVDNEKLLEFIEFWRKAFWMTTLNGDYQQLHEAVSFYPNDYFFEDYLALRPHPEFPLPELPAKVPTGLVPELVRSYLQSWAGLRAAFVRDADVELLNVGLFLSIMFLLTADENGSGTRTWEQHENALAPLLRLAKSVPEVAGHVTELPFTRAAVGGKRNA